MINAQISAERLDSQAQHKPFIIWFSGLSGSGKSTLSNALRANLQKLDISTYILDGDELRAGLNKDLGFSYSDRFENIRRTSEVAKMMLNAGITVLVAAITPLEEYRKLARSILSDNIVEVYVKATLEQCIDRDPKSLYNKALKGEIDDFTAIDSRFEEPVSPDLILNTGSNDIKSCVQNLINYLSENKLI